MRRRRLIVFAGLSLLLGGCTTKQDKDGHGHTSFDPKYLAKTEIDRVVDTSREQVVESMMRIADKLYRRNPREWKKVGLPDREAALVRLRTYRVVSPEGMEGRTEGAAAILAFSPEFTGDRVAALMYGLLTMIDAAYEHKDEFFILDVLNEQKLYNCARNMEVVIWKLGSSRNEEGEILLLSNELTGENRNLSFEREFGKAIGILDFVSKVVADRNGRAVTRVTHSIVATFFLPVGLLK